MNSVKKIVLYIDSEPFVGGAFKYNRAILEATSALPKDKYSTVVVFTNRLWDQYIDNKIESVYVPFSKSNKWIIQLLLMTSIPMHIISLSINRFHPVAKTLIDQKPDLCIFPSQETFWGYITKIPSIVTIHDLMHRYEKRFKEVSVLGKYIYKEKHFKNICRHVKGILVDSELGKRHVHDSYSFPLDNIHLLPYVSTIGMSNKKSILNIKRKYILPPKYIFYPAQFWQHKNHMQLIKAIHYLRNEIPDIQLVLIGSKKNEYEKVVKLVRDLGLCDVVHFMGFVPEGDLMEFYKKATALVMPTFFGPTNIPPLEAFALGCPVAVSDVYGMSEQVGDAGLLFDPKNVTEIADVIKRLWLQDDLRQRLIQNGFNKARRWGQSEFNKKFMEIVENIEL